LIKNIQNELDVMQMIICQQYKIENKTDRQVAVLYFKN